MRHLFVCCDGTWNAPTAVHDGVPVPTNVVRFYNAIDDRQDRSRPAQLKYYHPGIGSSGSVLSRLYEGATGSGIAQHISSAYKWIGDHFEADDRLFVIGFSRGAYTVRSLVGMLHKVGLVSRPTWADVSRAYALYRMTRGSRFTAALNDFVSALGDRYSVPPVYFVGVWDTVGALGIPLPPSLAWLMPGLNHNQFHDTSLSPTVTHAYHAVAIDEQRASFTPTLWTFPSGSAAPPTVQQVWFPGVHADVGGGYQETGLSDGALAWMLDRASAAGASFDAALVSQVRPDARGVLHDSYTGLFGLGASQPRSMPLLDAGPPAPPASQSVGASVGSRRAQPPITQCPYRTSRRLAVGDVASLDAYAREPWNWTSIFVARGEMYRFKANPAREWRDASISCSAAGYSRFWLAPFASFRRVPSARWFELCGAVGDAGNPSISGVPANETLFRIGPGCTWKSNADGYLYLFANDVNGFYFNNRGSVQVTVERL